MYFSINCSSICIFTAESRTNSKYFCCPKSLKPICTLLKEGKCFLWDNLQEIFKPSFFFFFCCSPVREGKLLLLSLFLQVSSPACDVEQFRADEKKESVIKEIKKSQSKSWGSRLKRTNVFLSNTILAKMTTSAGPGRRRRRVQCNYSECYNLDNCLIIAIPYLWVSDREEKFYQIGRTTEEVCMCAPFAYVIFAWRWC